MNVNGTLVPQSFVGTAGQTVFNITNFTYTPGTNSLLVFINGQRQTLRDFAETSTTSFTLTEGVAVGDFVDIIGFPQTTLTAITAANSLYQLPRTGSLLTTVQTKLDSFIDVVADYGADPTGVVDSAAAINAAINAVAAAGAVTLWFRIGTYKITSPILSNNRGVVFLFNGSTVNLSTTAQYAFNLSGSSCELRDVNITKGGAVVVTAAIYCTGNQHVFRRVVSANQIWPIFFLCQDVKESHWSEIRIDNDVSGKTGFIFQFDYCVNNTLSDSMLGYCAQVFFGSSLAQPTFGYHNEGILFTNIICVVAGKAINFDNGTAINAVNCVFDFIETIAVFISNGGDCFISCCWIASNLTNGFIGVGCLAGVSGMKIIGNVFQRGAAAITGTSGVSLQGADAIVIGNTFKSGMNGGTITAASSQVFGNIVDAPGTALANSGNNGLTYTASAGSATAGVNGALPAQVAGYLVTPFGKIPYYNT